MATASDASASPEKKEKEERKCEEWPEDVESERTTEEEMKCPVCLELFQDPKMLPCGHLVCARCLVNWLQANDMPRTCPKCRAPITEDEICRLPATMTPEEICQALPTELSMAALVSAFRKLQEPHKCSKCAQEATCFCLTCSIKLCRECRRKHAKAFNKKVSKAEAKRMAAVEKAGTSDLGLDEDHPNIPYVAPQRHNIDAISNLTPEMVCRGLHDRCKAHPLSEDNWNLYYCDTHEKTACLLCIRDGDHGASCSVRTVESKMEESRQVLREQRDRLIEHDKRLQEQYDRVKEKEVEAGKKNASLQQELDAMMDRMLLGLQGAKEKLTQDMESTETLPPTQRLRQQTSLLHSFRTDMKNLFAMDEAESLVRQFEDYTKEMKGIISMCPNGCHHSRHGRQNQAPAQAEALDRAQAQAHEFRSIAETMKKEIDQAVDSLQDTFVLQNLRVLRDVNIDALYPNTTNYDSSGSNADPPSDPPTYQRHISDID